MTRQKLSEDQIRKIVKEEFSNLISEHNLSDEDIQILYRPPTRNDIMRTGPVLEYIATIKNVAVYAVKMGKTVVKLFVLLASLHSAAYLFGEIWFPGSVPDAKHIARLIRSGTLTIEEKVSEELQDIPEEFIVVSNRFVNLTNDEYWKQTEIYIDNPNKTEELLMDNQTILVSSGYVPEGIVNRSISSSSSSLSSLSSGSFSSSSISSSSSDDGLV